jgi:hypothetical protein
VGREKIGQKGMKILKIGHVGPVMGWVEAVRKLDSPPFAKGGREGLGLLLFDYA